MNLCMIALCISLSQGRPQAPDRWVAEDKWKHFFGSFVATVVAAGAARATGLDAEESAWVGAGVGAGVGVWKELRDGRQPEGRVSAGDLVWDAAGIGAGAAVALRSR